MTGKEIKKIIKDSGYSLTKISEKMSESPQNLNSLLKSNDIKTGVLSRIAEAMDVDITYFFKDFTLQKASNNKKDKAKSSDNISNTINTNKIEHRYNDDNLHTLISILNNTIVEKDKQIDKLLSIVEQMNNQRINKNI